MPRTENQKVKILYIAKYFLENSDEDTYVETKNIIEHLKSVGIEAERRSIYRDIYALRDIFGMDIQGSQGSYFKLASREFAFNDLLLLAECVNAAKFISEDKAYDLVETLEHFCSVNQSMLLTEQTYLTDRNRTENDDTIDIVRTIRKAMATVENGKARVPTKVMFKYMTHYIDKGVKQTERRNGAYYIVSPYKLMLNDGYMYLMGYDEDTKSILTYRVDRMRDLEILDEPRDGGELFNPSEMKEYAKRVFSMFGGETKKVIIRFTNDMLDTAVDRFGTGRDVEYRKADKSHFTVAAAVSVSNTFFSWICGFRKKAVIISPPEVVEDFKNFLKDIQNKYE